MWEWNWGVSWGSNNLQIKGVQTSDPNLNPNLVKLEFKVGAWVEGWVGGLWNTLMMEEIKVIKQQKAISIQSIAKYIRKIWKKLKQCLLLTKHE